MVAETNIETWLFDLLTSYDWLKIRIAYIFSCIVANINSWLSWDSYVELINDFETPNGIVLEVAQTSIVTSIGHIYQTQFAVTLSYH